MTAATLLPAAERRAAPWRNGGGTTWTVAAWPPDSGPDAFGWRLSIAEVAADGPFSRFPGVERHLAILDGRLELSFGSAAGVILDPASEPLVFAGDAEVTGSPRDGPARDLNLMLDWARYRGSMRHVRGAVLREGGGGTALLVAAGAATITCDGAAFALSHTDALRLGDGAREEIAVAGSAWLVDIRPR